MSEDFDAPILARELARHVEAIVGRAVVDNENTQGFDALMQNAADAVPEKSAVLKAGNNDIDTAHHQSFQAFPMQRFKTVQVHA